MKKRILCAVLAAGIAAGGSSPVLAANTAVKVVGTQCQVSGTANPHEPISLLLTDGEKTNGNADKILGMYDGEADADGNWSATLEFTEDRIRDSYDYLTLFVNTGGVVEEQKIDYATTEDKKSFYQEHLYQASGKDAVKAVLTNPEYKMILTLMGFEVELLQGMNAAAVSNVAEVLMASGALNGTVIADAVTAYGDAVKLSLIGSGAPAAATALDDYQDFYGLSFEGVDWAAAAKTAELKKWLTGVLEKSAPYKTAQAMNEVYSQGYALYQINHSGAYGEVSRQLEKYAVLLGVDGTADYQYFLNNKTKVAKELYAIIYKSPAQDAQTLKNDLSKAVDKAKQSGGGGGGGGTGGGSLPAVHEIPAVKPGDFSEVQQGGEDNNSSAGGFTDMDEGHWAYASVRKLAEKGVVSGYEDNTYRPGNDVNREEFVKMLISASGIATLGGTTPFSDVEYGKWYSAYVATAYLYDIVGGVSKTEFGMGMNVTRQDAAVMIYRTLNYMGKTIEPVRQYSGFSDEDEIADYAKEAVSAMYCAGLLNGDENGGFHPRGTAKRSDAAVMIAGFLDFI